MFFRFYPNLKAFKQVANEIQTKKDRMHVLRRYDKVIESVTVNYIKQIKQI